MTRNVVGTSEQKTTEAWWELLSRRESSAAETPRNLEALAEKYPGRPMLIVASATYLKAIACDVRKALERLDDPDLLSIISAGAKKVDGLEEHLVPCDARLQALVGGARRSLNTRVARYVLSTERTTGGRAQPCGIGIASCIIWCKQKVSLHA